MNADAIRKQCFSMDYMKPDDVKSSEGDGLYIQDVKIAAMPDGKEKPVIYFSHYDKVLVCNRTNWEALIAILGNDTDQWLGRAIAFQIVDETYKGQPCKSIRVVKPKQQNGK